MAGNVREWCWNESPKAGLSGAEPGTMPIHVCQDLSQALPFDRSSRNGFRCVVYLDPDKIPKSTFELVKLR